MLTAGVLAQTRWAMCMHFTVVSEQLALVWRSWRRAMLISVVSAQIRALSAQNVDREYTAERTSTAAFTLRDTWLPSSV